MMFDIGGKIEERIKQKDIGIHRLPDSKNDKSSK